MCPKKYRLQLHAFINAKRPLAKDTEGKFSPLIFNYVLFSYWQEQPEAVYTCVEKDVTIGKPHLLSTKNCIEGEQAFQEVRVCANDETQQFKIADDDSRNIICEATSDTP